MRTLSKLYMQMQFNTLTPYIIFILGLIVYWSTMFPTITWWGAGEYAAAAVSLGITTPPGSLMLTIIGWLFLKIVPGNPAYVLNLLAAVTGSLVIATSFLTFRKILTIIKGEKWSFTKLENIGFSLTSLVIVFSLSIWEYSTKFTPYILTVLFTMIIIYAALDWWRKADADKSWLNIFWITLLLGLDFSVHRTNAVLIPGIILMMLIRNYTFLLNYKSWLAAFSGIIIGLSIQLLYIPMSLNDPIMNMGWTNNLQRWWDFISLKQYGGHFLLDIMERKGPFWSYQVPYYFERFAEQFIFFDRRTLITGYMPAVFGLLGIIHFMKLNKKFGLAFVFLFVITIAVSVVYFNLPENYFRTIYRHYLPTYIIFSVFMFGGVHYVFQYFSKFNHSKRISLQTIFIMILGLTVFAQLNKNLPIRDNSDNRIAYNHTKNILKSIDNNAILFSQGDNDLWPALYLQIGERYRRDVTHCNLWLLNLDWYLKQIQRHDTKFPSSTKGTDVQKMDLKNWQERHCIIVLDADVKSNYASPIDTVEFSLPALRSGNSVMRHDFILYEIIKNNRWHRPVYFVKQGLDSKIKKWLFPYLIDEGLVYKLVPISSQKTDIIMQEKNINIFNLQNFNDHSIFLDNVSLGAGKLYYSLFISVIKHKIDTGDLNNAQDYYELMINQLPLDRLKPNNNIQKEIDELKTKIYDRL